MLLRKYLLILADLLFGLLNRDSKLFACLGNASLSLPYLALSFIVLSEHFGFKGLDVALPFLRFNLYFVPVWRWTARLGARFYWWLQFLSCLGVLLVWRINGVCVGEWLLHLLPFQRNPISLPLLHILPHHFPIGVLQFLRNPARFFTCGFIRFYFRMGSVVYFRGLFELLSRLIFRPRTNFLLRLIRRQLAAHLRLALAFKFSHVNFHFRGARSVFGVFLGSHVDCVNLKHSSQFYL